VPWKPGPPPEGTRHYGAVMTARPAPRFAFADSRGDHALLVGGARVEAKDVPLWTNCIKCPPEAKGEISRAGNRD
jgi:hypothetical protein